jgi:hypothetical protein
MGGDPGANAVRARTEGHNQERGGGPQTDRPIDSEPSTTATGARGQRGNAVAPNAGRPDETRGDSVTAGETAPDGTTLGVIPSRTSEPLGTGSGAVQSEDALHQLGHKAGNQSGRASYGTPVQGNAGLSVEGGAAAGDNPARITVADDAHAVLLAASSPPLSDLGHAQLRHDREVINLRWQHIRALIEAGLLALLATIGGSAAASPDRAQEPAPPQIVTTEERLP